MKLVCGLGNPGPEYDDTRHNVGWWVVDRLALDAGTGPFHLEASALVARAARPPDVDFAKPLTYVNRSGAAVAALLAARALDPTADLLVVVDDVALDVGRLRLRPGGSAGGHNGLRSIEAVLGTQEYARLRVGVGAPPPGVELAEWVLSPFPEADEERILALLLDAAGAVRTWIEEGAEAAMSRHNR